MIEEDRFYKQEVWESLNQEERRICAILSVNASWYQGVPEKGMQMLWEDESTGIKKEVIDELVEKGIIELRNSWEYAQDYVEGNLIGLEEIKERKKQEKREHPTDSEASFIKTFRKYEHIVKDKIGEKSYRLNDERFHNNIQMIIYLGR